MCIMGLDDVLIKLRSISTITKSSPFMALHTRTHALTNSRTHGPTHIYGLFPEVVLLKVVMTFVSAVLRKAARDFYIRPLKMT